jgi:hypothetical protein
LMWNVPQVSQQANIIFESVKPLIEICNFHAVTRLIYSYITLCDDALRTAVS